MDLEADLKLMEIEIVATDQTDTKTKGINLVKRYKSGKGLFLSRPSHFL